MRCPKAARRLIGRVPDRDIAHHFGVPLKTVSRWRQELGFNPRKRKRERELPRKIREDTWDKYPGLREKLGKMPDAELGREYGLSRERIRQFRRNAGVPPYRKTHEEEIRARISDLLPLHKDREIHEMTGISVNTIRRIRHQMDIPIPASEREKTLAQVKARLGTMSDHKLAQETGLTDTDIYRLRKKLDVPPKHRYHKHNPIPRDKVRAMSLEGKTDTEIASALGASPLTIQQIRLSLGLKGRRKRAQKVDKDAIRQLVQDGLSDMEIAQRQGCSATTVTRIRCAMGIRRVPPKLPWDEIIPLLGTMPDRALGAMFNTSGATICMKRKALGIAPYGRRKGSEKAPPA